MSRNIGEIGLGLKLDGKNYKKQVKQFGDYGSSQLQNSFGSAFKSIGKMAIAAFSIKAVADFTASCLKLGSDLTEVQNVVDVAFPHMNEQINSFAKNAMTQFGMSETVAKKYAGTFGAMSKAFGFTEQASADMAMELTGLAGDVASFYNMNTDEAYTKLKSVFTGETETLKELGVVMTQNALDQYALANGYGKTTAKMTEQEKVALRMKFVTDQLSLASGDFVRTQDSWANQTRVLSLRFDQLKASLGKGFIAVFTPIVKGINWVLSNLQPLADSFASLMEMLTGTSTSSGGGGAMAETASEIASTTDSAGGLSDGLSDAGKAGEAAAKKINKAFAKTDTINKLSFNTDSDSGSSGGGSGAGGDTGSVADAVEFPKASEQANVFNGMLDGIIKEFQRLSNIFKTGFEIGFGNSFKNIERIKEYISSIGDSFKNIFTDPSVINAAKTWVDTTVLTLGKITGSIASIGVSIGTLLVGSVATYLERNTGFIKDNIVNMFNISSRFHEIIGRFSILLAEIVDVFANGTAVSIGANFIEGFVNGFLGSINLISRLAVDIFDAIVTPLEKNKDKIKKTIEGMLKPIESVTKTIAKGITDTFKLIDSTYSKYIAPAFTKISSGLTQILGSILDAYNTYIKPVIDMIAVNFTAMWNEHIQPALNGVVTFFGKFAELFGVVWEQYLAPFISWLVETFAPVIATMIENVWNKVELVVTFISDQIKALTDILQGICDFLTGVFTGDWDRAWQGLKDIVSGFTDFFTNVIDLAFGWVSGFIDETLDTISNVWNVAWTSVSDFFGGIWEDICSGVETSINGVKDTIDTVLDTIKGIWEGMWQGLYDFVSGTWDNIMTLWNSGGEIFTNIAEGIGTIFRNIVNGMIDGINTVIKKPLKVVSNALKTIHDIDLPLIGKPFTIVPRGFDIPQIPHLAQGGYVKANQPQLAMIGDNRHQGEIVAPENKMLDMINTALKMQKDSGNVDGMDTLIMLIKELIELVKNMVLKVDIDIKKLSILLENAKKERQMIGG